MKIFQAKNTHFEVDLDNIDFSDYEEVFSTIDLIDENKYGLEDIFRMFNSWTTKNGEPIEQTFRSLSVSDIVKLRNCYYICMPIGWEDITDKCREKTVLVGRS